MDCLLYVYLAVVINAAPPNWNAPRSSPEVGLGRRRLGGTRDALKQGPRRGAYGKTIPSSLR